MLDKMRHNIPLDNQSKQSLQIHYLYTVVFLANFQMYTVFSFRISVKFFNIVMHLLFKKSIYFFCQKTFFFMHTNGRNNVKKYFLNFFVPLHGKKYITI